MRRHIGRSVAILFLISSFSALLSARESSITAGIVQATEGEAFLDGHPLQQPIKDSVRLFHTGQTLSTKQGRVELIIASNGDVSVGKNTTLRWEPADEPTLNLKRGSIIIEVVDKLAKAKVIRVRLSKSTVEISKSGLYRLDSSSCKLRVYDGTALADNGSKQAQIKSGGEILLDSNLLQSMFDPKASDALHQWSAHRSFDIFLANRKTNNWKYEGYRKPSFQVYFQVFENANYRVRFETRMPMLPWPKGIQPNGSSVPEPTCIGCPGKW
jgi:hypothetical protein